MCAKDLNSEEMAKSFNERKVQESEFASIGTQIETKKKPLVSLLSQ